MTNTCTDVVPDLQPILAQRPAGISEFELMRLLRERGHLLFDAGDSLSLFRAHFQLFHSLYQLQQRLWARQAGHLEISPLRIVLMPYRPGVATLGETDTIRNYYLDPGNLTETTKTDVDQMRNRFWQHYIQPEGREQVLAILGLKDPVSNDAIKKRYRKLAMAHHPDRGGDSTRLQAIHEAVRLLLP